jgi:hypothetical protein
MKIKVNSARVEASKCLVGFSTDYGDADAVWQGDAPEINRRYDVELDIDGALVWGESVLISKSKANVIKKKIDGLIVITGVLDSLDDDGYAVLRIGDSIIPFMAEGNPFHVGNPIEISTDSLFLYQVCY